MKFEFEQTHEDLQDLTWNSFKSNKVIKLASIVIFIVIFLNIVLGFAMSNLTIIELMTPILPLLIIITIVVLLFKTKWMFLINKQSNHDLIVGKRKVEFLEHTVVYETAESTANLSWNTFTHVGKSKRNIFLYMGKRQAIILPIHIFENKKDQDEFMNFFYSKSNLS